MKYREKLLKSLISLDTPIVVPEGTQATCAVLLPIGSNSKTQQLDLIMTKRTDRVMTHKKQISFPGGYREEEDASLMQTALRESLEEIGLSANDVEVLGRLPEVTTHTTGILIYPFVGLFALPYEFKTSEDEVEKILYVPLDRIVEEGLPELTVEIEGYRIKSLGITHEDDLIWGASARMLEDLRKALLK
mgnify:CR=1 FL=1